MSNQYSQSYLKKSDALSSLLTSLGVVQNMVSDSKLLNNLRRRITQQNKSLNNPYVRNEDELLNFFCENNTKLSWSDVDEQLIDYTNSRTQIPGIEIDDLIQASRTLRENMITDESELNLSVTPELIRKIVKLMPVMYLKNGMKSVLINLHEFVVTPGAFEMIMLLDKNCNEEDSDEVVVLDESCKISSQKGKGGQPSIVSKFPNIVDEVSEFIKQHGFSAQNRRRTETGFSCGVTAKQIQQHLYDKYPDLKEHKISLTTIRRLFSAPNKHFKAADRYKSLVNARVGTKQNSYMKMLTTYSHETKCGVSWGLYSLII